MDSVRRSRYASIASYISFVVVSITPAAAFLSLLRLQMITKARLPTAAIEILETERSGYN